MALFEQVLIDAKAIDADAVRALKQEAKDEVDAAVRQATSEAKPLKTDVLTGTYAPSDVDAIYPEDYTGLPSADALARSTPR